MSDYFRGHTTVLSGHGFDENGPYLALNDTDSAVVRCFSVRGTTFSLRRLERRRCTGRFDLETMQKSTCPLNVELLPDAKEDMCPACMEATGFNPSFYYSDFVSPRQRAYNLTPHFVYLAYFSSQHVKAGISSQTRGIERLLEQGARAACIVGRFENAYDARELEAALCSQPGILETMRTSLKTRLLVEERFVLEEATSVLERETSRLAVVEAVASAGFAPEVVQDLSIHYFGGSSPDVHDLQLPEGHDDVCGGRCVGMVGGALVFEQGGTNYVVPVKGWESYEVKLLENEVVCEYDFAPQQMSLL